MIVLPYTADQRPQWDDFDALFAGGARWTRGAALAVEPYAVADHCREYEAYVDVMRAARDAASRAHPGRG